MSDLPYSILSEDPVPEVFADCSKCELCTQGSRIIWGEGNHDAPTFILLDNPGLREDKNGVPFLCGTRKTMQELAFQTGLMLDKLYITFVVKCRPVRSYSKAKARAICLENFYWQLEKYKPEAIFCLGNVAIKALLSDDSAEVKTMRGRWHNWLGYSLAVSYHPLAVRRYPNLVPNALKDWHMVAKKVESIKIHAECGQ
jgi:DNA polymerase